MAPRDSVDQYLQGLEAASRCVADGEWGVTIADAGGWPLDIGLRLDRGVLRAQAEVLAPDQISDHELLFRNRSLMFVRYAHTSAGAVYVMGELPPELITAEWLDRLLGMLLDAAIVARHRAAAGRAA
jgi:hypothetical protein